MFPPFTAHRWINEPSTHRVRAGTCSITTDPRTDFWQRTYYGFRNTNAHGLLFAWEQNLTFSIFVV
jgi:regulation of enolase protein 1 (concanavalin A-like superfamily)